VVDSLNRRLGLVGWRRGLSIASSRYQPLDRGILGWVVRRGVPQVLEALDERTGDCHAVVCLPLVTSRPHGLLVLENVALTSASRDGLSLALGQVVACVTDLLAREEDHDLAQLQGEMDKRLLDGLEAASRLPQPQADEALLELSTRILAAEAAMWIPSGGALAIRHAPTPLGTRLLEQAEESLEAISCWVRDRGAVAGGAFAPGWDAMAPRGPSPYVGVLAGGGSLIVFFSPEEETGSPAQLPTQVHFETLGRIAERISRRAIAA
jgi:hypothetical protein